MIKDFQQREHIRKLTFSAPRIERYIYHLTELLFIIITETNSHVKFAASLCFGDFIGDKIK